MTREMIVFKVHKQSTKPGMKFFEIQEKYSEQDIETKKILMEEIKL